MKHIKNFENFASNNHLYENEVNPNDPNSIATYIRKNSNHYTSFLDDKSIQVTIEGPVVIIKPKSESFEIIIDTENKTIESARKPKYPESRSYMEIMSDIKSKTKFTILNPKSFMELNLSVIESLNNDINEELGVAEYDEYINPAHLIITLTDGRQLKIDRRYVKGGKKSYDAILYFLENMNKEPKAKAALLTIIQQMVDNLNQK